LTRSSELEARRDRAIGALLGLAAGDAVGTTLEFTTRDSGAHVLGMEGGGPFRLLPGQWTDDTSMALCLADSILACGELDQHDLMQRFTRWCNDGENSVNGVCFDIGVTTHQAIARFERTGVAKAGSTDPDKAGNGSLMRLSPVAIRWHGDEETAIDAAILQSETTHGAPEAVDACAYFTSLLVAAISGADKAIVLTQAKRPYSGAIGRIAAGSWKGKTRSQISASGYVAHTLEAALWAVDSSTSFEEAVLLAANLGEDADTVAAVTGQLAGAIWGEKAIPPQWRKTLAKSEHIRLIANQLFEAGLAHT
jgi:ADP-ribosyl-[dinitrogen reductase] hydrolase